jgi:hypothetical protein
MTDCELFIKALDALEWNLPVIQDYGDKEQLNIQHNAINALRDRLAQPEQLKAEEHSVLRQAIWETVEVVAPPQRLWVGLTTQDIHKAVVDTGIHVFEGDIYKFVNLLEQILQERNA